MKIEDLEKLTPYCDDGDNKNTEVSQASIYWHLDHIFQVITGISKALIKSDPSQYKSKFSPSWAGIKLAGIIPRGAGKAPKSVQPQNIKDSVALLDDLESTKSILKRVHMLNKRAHFDHPVFGTLDLKNSLKFLKIHTNHHLKIIDDILK